MSIWELCLHNCTTVIIMFAIFVYLLASFFLPSIDYLIIDEMMFVFLPFVGLKGQSNRRLISLEEVKQHKAGDCIWTVLKGRVYDIAPYMKFHPGGSHSSSSCRVILFEFQNHCSRLTSHNLFCIMIHFLTCIMFWVDLQVLICL